MKILYASERPPYPFFLGGAARSAHYLLSTLIQDFGVDCLAVGSREFSGAAWQPPPESHFADLGVSAVSVDDASTTAHCGYRSQVLGDFPAALRRTIDAFAPDVVWTQLDGVDAVARIAHDAGRPVLVYLRDAEDPPPVLKALADLGCGFVCNSRFMANRVQRLAGRTPYVIYPSLEASFGVQGDPDGAITMINPHRVKGIDTFIEIARRLPHEPFLLVESWPLSDSALQAITARLAPLANVRFQRRVPDAGEIYRQTKLLLVPSVWEEAFGRVVIEAQSCGIPVLASRRGGLPESVGDGGICIDDYRNADAWVQQVRRVLGDPRVYQDLAAKARAHAASEAFTTRHAAHRFFDICTDPGRWGAPDTVGSRSLWQRLLNVGGR